MKTANIEETNLCNLMNFNEVFSKNVTFDKINRHKKQGFTFSPQNTLLEPPSNFRVN